ncbi:MAG: hypothetical protein KIT69_08340 [Propionibacteriaceae bacterium]|nr:hypothetical protein [Propionibacteriaceae bacterium]
MDSENDDEEEEMSGWEEVEGEGMSESGEEMIYPQKGPRYPLEVQLPALSEKDKAEYREIN